MTELLSFGDELALAALVAALILPAGRWGQTAYCLSGAAAAVSLSGLPDAAPLSHAAFWPGVGALLLAGRIYFSKRTLDLSGFWVFVITGAIQAIIILALFEILPADSLLGTLVLVALGVILPLIALSRLFRCDASIAAFTTGGTFIFVGMGTAEPICLRVVWPLCHAPTLEGVIALDVLAVMIGVATQFFRASVELTRS